MRSIGLKLFRVLTAVFFMTAQVFAVVLCCVVLLLRLYLLPLRSIVVGALFALLTGSDEVEGQRKGCKNG